jgi:hypothetical protein
MSHKHYPNSNKLATMHTTNLCSSLSKKHKSQPNWAVTAKVQTPLEQEQNLNKPRLISPVLRAWYSNRRQCTHKCNTSSRKVRRIFHDKTPCKLRHTATVKNHGTVRVLVVVHSRTMPYFRTTWCRVSNNRNQIFKGHRMGSFRNRKLSLQTAAILEYQQMVILTLRTPTTT